MDLLSARSDVIRHIHCHRQHRRLRVKQILWRIILQAGQHLEVVLGHGGEAGETGAEVVKGSAGAVERTPRRARHEVLRAVHWAAQRVYVLIHELGQVVLCCVRQLLQHTLCIALRGREGLNQ